MRSRVRMMRKKIAEKSQDSLTFTLADTVEIGTQIGINWDDSAFPPEEFLAGLEVELEHGSALGPDTNITDDDPVLTGRIALAHLLESPVYYTELAKMEQGLDDNKQLTQVEGATDLYLPQEKLAMRKDTGQLPKSLLLLAEDTLLDTQVDPSVVNSRYHHIIKSKPASILEPVIKNLPESANLEKILYRDDKPLIVYKIAAYINANLERAAEQGRFFRLVDLEYLKDSYSWFVEKFEEVLYEYFREANLYEEDLHLLVDSLLDNENFMENVVNDVTSGRRGNYMMNNWRKIADQIGVEVGTNFGRLHPFFKNSDLYYEAVEVFQDAAEDAIFPAVSPVVTTLILEYLKSDDAKTDAIWSMRP